MRAELRPGPWLRLTALAAAVATGLVVVSGSLGLSHTHRGLALVALPPLVALVVAAQVAHRRLLFPAGGALALFAQAMATWWSSGVHVALACGGASALNHLLDRDIDRLMGKRTAKRPVAAGRVPPARALEFGLVLSALSFVLLASTVNVLTAALALVGNLFYVVVYTRWLKRATPQNIVIGGAAGAVPPLVGYAAATGNLGLPALWLFLIVFLWTPPHFWALALLIKENYAAAKVPMLPVVRGDAATTRQILAYSVVMVAFSTWVGLWLGPVYTCAAVVLGGILLWLSWIVRREPSRRNAGVLFHYSLLYLALLFVAAAVDPVLL